MFGEIEDLSHAGSFNQQNHSIGPTLFWKPGEKEEEGDEEEAKGDKDNDKASGPSEMQLSFNIGLQFGVTDATSDTALNSRDRFRSRRRKASVSASGMMPGASAVQIGSYPV